jgi:hypothetical protein
MATALRTVGISQISIRSVRGKRAQRSSAHCVDAGSTSSSEVLADCGQKDSVRRAAIRWRLVDEPLTTQASQQATERRLLHLDAPRYLDLGHGVTGLADQRCDRIENAPLSKGQFECLQSAFRATPPAQGSKPSLDPLVYRAELGGVPRTRSFCEIPMFLHAVGADASLGPRARPREAARLHAGLYGARQSEPVASLVLWSPRRMPRSPTRVVGTPTSSLVQQQAFQMRNDRAAPGAERSSRHAFRSPVRARLGRLAAPFAVGCRTAVAARLQVCTMRNCVGALLHVCEHTVT